MKPILRTILSFIGLAGGGVCGLAAQTTPGDHCIVTYTGQNQNRTIAADSEIAAECGGGWHTAPYGNWGVTSNYGHVQDSVQFPGHHPGRATATQRRIWEWNSCPVLYPEPNGQRSTRGVATHGARIHRIALGCGGDSIFFPIPSSQGCNAAPRTWNMNNNFMSLYELDWDGNDFITTLYFPTTRISMNCNYYGCADGTSEWVEISRSTEISSGVDAEMRTKVSARYQPGCVW